MIATQTKALLVDAYRDLNARKMFWVVLFLNVIVIAGFGTLGVKGNRMSILTWELPQDIPFALFVYKWIFSYVIVGRWLSWVATILALISTASIFPDFLAGGAVDLYLSKPIGRLRLFITKYITGLLFVTLQVTVFTIGSFLVLGFRADLWEPGLFLAIPIVVLFFSYLFSICVLMGVWTRSTLTAFFLTLVTWAGIAGVNQADRFLMQADVTYQSRAQEAQRQLTRLDKQIAEIQARDQANKAHFAATPGATPAASTQPTPETLQLKRLARQRDRQIATAAQQQPPHWVRTAQPIVFAINTLVPKTQDTISLLDRVLFKDVSITAVKSLLNTVPDDGPMHGWRRDIQDMVHGRSMAWILGSSIAFECLMLALAARTFCRRDY